MLKKAGFILFLAGLTLGLATLSSAFVMPHLVVGDVAARDQQPQPRDLADGIVRTVTWEKRIYIVGAVTVGLAFVGAGLLVFGMVRSGPRDEELPTADAAVSRETKDRR